MNPINTFLTVFCISFSVVLLVIMADFKKLELDYRIAEYKMTRDKTHTEIYKRVEADKDYQKWLIDNPKKGENK